MRSSLVLVTSVVTASLIAAACGDSGDSTFGNGSSGDGDGGFSSSGFIPSDNTSSSSGGDPDASTAAGDIDTTSMRIEPADAVLTVNAGQTVTQGYKVFGKLKGSSVEQDLTSRVVFWVPDNYLVGTFPKDGAPLFTSRLPAVASDPPQRGGKLTVEAIAANSTGKIKVRTSLTVKLLSTLDSPAVNPALPANPATLFTGAPDAARKPALAYPNNGTMLPPNLRRLEVQWRRGHANNQLFEISFKSAAAEIVYYSRCGGGAGYVANACGFELDEAGYGHLAESNRGAGPVKLRIRATDDTGTAHGASDEFTIEFAENRVDGGLYYWTVTNPESIMRFDFGAAGGDPEAFVIKDQNGIPNTCPGCHALSRQGTKLVASIGGQWDGRLIYINDLSKPKTASDWLTIDPDTNDGGLNRIQFASFNPDGSKFVAVYGDVGNVGSGAPGSLVGNPKPANPQDDVNKLFFHDGTTGLRTGSKTLTFKPNHPEWSPDGETIAVTRVANTNTTTQMPKRTSIEILKKSGNDWTDPVALVPQLQDHARYNPNFVPDSSFLYYSESICPGNWDSNDCNADADPSAKTWAIKPVPGSTPVLLANAAKAGVEDGAATNLGDTFPRSAPFKTKHRDGQLFWFTVASRRKVGLRATQGAQHLWMFAVDPAKVLAGQDGSYTGFYLPFQDLQTSNHIGQWTEKIVGGTQQPPPQPPPPPPPPVPPPPNGPK